jgi:hypothetical protein
MARGMLELDANSVGGLGYANYSIYFDNPAQRLYAEKEEGLSFRTKPRLRVYRRWEDLSPLAYYLELKHRVRSLVVKERVAIDADAARRLLDTFATTRGSDGLPESPVMDKFLYLAHRHDLRPALCVLYRRQAYTCAYYPGLRITYDRFVSASARPGLDTEAARFQPIIPPHETIIEIKYDERLPNWIGSIVRTLEMQRVSISKYVAAAAYLARDRRRVGGMFP